MRTDHDIKSYVENFKNQSYDLTALYQAIRALDTESKFWIIIGAEEGDLKDLVEKAKEHNVTIYGQCSDLTIEDSSIILEMCEIRVIGTEQDIRNYFFEALFESSLQISYKEWHTRSSGNDAILEVEWR